MFFILKNILKNIWKNIKNEIKVVIENKILENTITDGAYFAVIYIVHIKNLLLFSHEGSCTPFPNNLLFHR